jgi:hypothetical protein
MAVMWPLGDKGIILIFTFYYRWGVRKNILSVLKIIYHLGCINIEK